jgi:cytoskeletal protein RodZ
MSLGTYLKRERERRHVSVAELAQTTRIPVRILRHLENDEHEQLPADVFVRGYLRAYAKVLNLPEARVLARLSSREESDAPPPPLPAVYAPESGRKFGIAIALFILLILFTLALSIVLRPRHRDAPVELSRYELVSPCSPSSSAKLSSCAASTTVKPTVSSRC